MRNELPRWREIVEDQREDFTELRELLREGKFARLGETDL